MCPGGDAGGGCRPSSPSGPRNGRQPRVCVVRNAPSVQPPPPLSPAGGGGGRGGAQRTVTPTVPRPRDTYDAMCVRLPCDAPAPRRAVDRVSVRWDGEGVGVRV